MAQDVITICPECGAKIPKAGMSLCPYCASPLKTTPGKEQDRNPILQRLKRVEEKPEYAEHLQESPPWSPAYQRARNRRTQGSMILVIGLALAALAFFLASSEGISLFTYVGGVVAIAGAALFIRGAGECKKLDAMPVLKRSACLIERRSEAFANGNVVYFFLIQFGDGSEGEFSYPGRGVSEELYANGMLGVAYTRGQELLFVKRVRV